MEIFSIILLIAIILLQLADVITTNIALKLPNRTESNKFLKIMMDKIGVLPTLISTKVPVILFLIAAYMYYNSIYLTGAMIAICIFYGWVIWNNLHQIN